MRRQELKDRDDVRGALARDLEAERFAADRAFRQYDATDPQNRLVAAELELRWNLTLERVTDLQQRIDDYDRQRPAPASTIPEDFTSLASDLPTVWSDPAADARLKKRIVRTLINEVIADIEPQAGEIVLVLHWASGIHTELRVPRRRRGQRNSTAVEIIDAVRVLVCIADDTLIAGLLNRNKLITGHGNRWTRERVTAIRSHHKIPVYSRQIRDCEGWMTLTQAAKVLSISAKTLRLAAERRAIGARHPPADGPWAYHHGVRIDFSGRGKPTDNAFIETFNRSLRDECLNLHWYDTIAQASQLIEAWRRDYNESRPHMALGNLPPAEYASRTGTRYDITGSSAARN